MQLCTENAKSLMQSCSNNAESVTPITVLQSTELRCQCHSIKPPTADLDPAPRGSGQIRPDIAIFTCQNHIIHPNQPKKGHFY